MINTKNFEDTTESPLKLDDGRIIALNTSPWPVSLFEDFEGGRDDINMRVKEGAGDRLFGTHIREAIRVLRNQL